MEIVLQWLDEIEDTVFTVALVWETLRRALLQIGLCAAVALQFTLSAAYALAYAKLLAGVALSSVLVWIASLVVSQLARSLARRPAAA